MSLRTFEYENRPVRNSSLDSGISRSARDTRTCSRATVAFIAQAHARCGVGEVEDVASRLRQHNAEKSGNDFWNRVVVITSKDENLTKGHIRYVESRLIVLPARPLARARRVELVNGNQSARATLPADQREEGLGRALRRLTVCPEPMPSATRRAVLSSIWSTLGERILNRPRTPGRP